MEERIGVHSEVSMSSSPEQGWAENDDAENCAELSSEMTDMLLHTLFESHAAGEEGMLEAQFVKLMLDCPGVIDERITLV